MSAKGQERTSRQALRQKERPPRGGLSESDQVQFAQCSTGSVADLHVPQYPATITVDDPLAPDVAGNQPNPPADVSSVYSAR
jgi:hypothetical protein